MTQSMVPAVSFVQFRDCAVCAQPTVNSFRDTEWILQALLNGWKAVLHTLPIQPIRRFRYTTGKNATDSALIIDAMDLLHGESLDGLCLASSDSDFTRLATRVRKSGLMVYGFGERKTPEPFVVACDKFVYTEILRPLAEAEAGDQLLGGLVRKLPYLEIREIPGPSGLPNVQLDVRLSQGPES